MTPVSTRHQGSTARSRNRRRQQIDSDRNKSDSNLIIIPSPHLAPLDSIRPCMGSHQEGTETLITNSNQVTPRRRTRQSGIEDLTRAHSTWTVRYPCSGSRVPTSSASIANPPTFSSIFATTSILFAATASCVHAAPRPPSQPRPNRERYLSPRQFEKSRVIESDSDSASTSIVSHVAERITSARLPGPTIVSSRATVTPPPEDAFGKTRKRQVLPKYEYSNGSWIVDTGWTLRGSVPSIAPLHTRHRATALADSIETTPLAASPLSPVSASSSSSSSRTRVGTSTATTLSSSSSMSTTMTGSTTTTTRPHTPAFNQHAYASASDVPIPRGWQTRPRETDYYAVPIIIAMSVLVAIIVVIAILGSVCWRKKKRRRRDPEKDFIQEKGWRGIVQRATRGGQRGRPEEKRRRKAKKSAAAETATAAGAVVTDPGRPDDGGDAQSLRESVGSAGSGNRTPRIVRTTGFSAVSERSGPRWRRRRGRRDGQEDDSTSDVEERTALTRTDTRSTTSSAGGPRDALTARLSARIHGSAASTSHRGRSGPSTVFSQLPIRNRSSSDLSRSEDRFPRTSTQESHLTRSTSRSSLYGLGSVGPAIPPPSILFTPADDPTLSPRPPGTPAFETLSRVPSRTAPAPSPALSQLQASDPLPPVSPPTSTPSSFNALLSHDADLALPLMPGPPAYRPASSTVQSTRRYGAGDSPAVVSAPTQASQSSGPRVGNSGRRRRRSERAREGGVEENRGEQWHWPGEKGSHLLTPDAGSDMGATAGPSSPSPFALGNDVELGQEEEEADPPVDRSLYQAHLATDDKAVLHRLRTATYRSEEEGSEVGRVMSRSRLELPAASAPPVIDGEVDEDGFERYDPRQVAGEVDHSREGGFTGSEVPTLNASTSASPRSGPISTLLPTPPSRSDFTYSYLARSSSSNAPNPSKSALAEEYARLDNAREGEELDLPVYLPQDRRNEALQLASAPPATDDDEDDEEDQGDVDVEGNSFATI